MTNGSNGPNFAHKTSSFNPSSRVLVNKAFNYDDLAKRLVGYFSYKIDELHCFVAGHDPASKYFTVSIGHITLRFFRIAGKIDWTPVRLGFNLIY